MKIDVSAVSKDKKLTEDPTKKPSTNAPKTGFPEYSRNLLHKNIYEKNTIDLVFRDRMNLGKRITVPVFYEEEQLFKVAANASIDETGRVYSLNDFIRVAVIKAAYDVLGKEEADRILAEQFNLIATEPTTDVEREIERMKRTEAKSPAIRSESSEYPRDPNKTVKKRKSPEELKARGRKSVTV